MASIFELQNPPFGQLTKTKVIKTENGAHTLTTAELPSHTHGLNIPSSENGGSYNAHALFPDGSSSNQAFTTDSTGSGSAHNNVQPYIVAYMWRRTA